MLTSTFIASVLVRCPPNTHNKLRGEAPSDFIVLLGGVKLVGLVASGGCACDSFAAQQPDGPHCVHWPTGTGVPKKT